MENSLWLSHCCSEYTVTVCLDTCRCLMWCKRKEAMKEDIGENSEG